MADRYQPPPIGISTCNSYTLNKIQLKEGPDLMSEFGKFVSTLVGSVFRLCVFHHHCECSFRSSLDIQHMSTGLNKNIGTCIRSEAIIKHKHFAERICKQKIKSAADTFLKTLLKHMQPASISADGCLRKRSYNTLGLPTNLATQQTFWLVGCEPAQMTYLLLLVSV